MTAAWVSLLILSGPPAPEIVTRDMWQAKPRLAGAKAHVINRLTVHHTGVKSNPNRSLEEKLRGLQSFSQRAETLASGKQKPAWPDVPYHYYISIDGRIGEGREWFFAGDTNTEYDPTGHLLVVVEGEFDQERPTAAQMKTLTQFSTWACWKWRLKSDEIMGHKDFSTQTACPGAALETLLPQLRKDVQAGLNELYRSRRSRADGMK